MAARNERLPEAVTPRMRLFDVLSILLLVGFTVGLIGYLVVLTLKLKRKKLG